MGTDAAGGPAILVVCRANETRSPLYAAVLAAALARRGASWRVGSAGTHAAADRPARADVRAVASELGLVLDAHRSRRLTPELVADAQLIVTAEREQRDTIAQLVPGAADRTFTVTELAALLEGVAPPAPRTPAEVAALAHAQRPRRPRAASDLADPTGRGRVRHRVLARQVTQAVGPVADAIGGPEVGRADVGA